MKVTIIGSSSFLAKNIVATTEDITWNLINKEAYFFPKSPILNLDYDSILDSDAIIFTVGAGIQPGHNDSNNQIFELNCFEVIRLIQHLNEENYKGKLITFGSYFELGIQQSQEPASEYDLVLHTNPYPNAYCESKNLLSRFINQRLISGNTFEHQHYVLTNVFGVGENKNRLIPHILQQIKIGAPISFTSGTQKRQYTDVRDVASFIINQALKKSKQGIFNLTSRHIHTVGEVINIVIQTVRKNGQEIPEYHFGEINKRDSGMSILSLNVSKTFDEFGAIPETNLNEAIAHYVSQFYTK
ncbi:NAD-dependent epimerase/dehydratase family protein [Ekhidna sp.]|uniref:NAD-dependent epimerase/dehydratase family protein n=1 Tax=Ekhidna sp. TaxID=2608089 RepID=UPI003516B6C1